MSSQPTRLVLDPYQQAYDLRLVEWLGLDPAKIHRIDDVDIWGNAPLGDGKMFLGITVRWDTLDDLTQAVAKRPGWWPLPRSASGGRDMPTVIGEGVRLDTDEAERMRAEVGPRPDLLTPEQRAALQRAAVSTAR